MNAESRELANRLVLAYRDMDDVKRYISAYVELDAMQKQTSNSRFFDHCEAALVAAVVAYCRPFKKSRSIGKATSLLKTTDLDCLRNGGELTDLHELIVAKRDTVIAHADWSHHNTELVAVSRTSVSRRVSVPDLANGIDLQKFMSLAETVRQEVVCRSHALDTCAERGGAA